jgi:hypothetical protein
MEFDVQEQMPASFLAERWRLRSTCCPNKLDEAIHMLLGLLWMVFIALQNCQPRMASAICLPTHILVSKYYNRIYGPFVESPLCNSLVNYSDGLASVPEKDPFIRKFQTCHVCVVRTGVRDEGVEERLVSDCETIPLKSGADVG